MSAARVGADRPGPPVRKQRPQRPKVPPREVRLIGGAWKRSKLPVADRPGLRPTPDRVRETLFNWLGQDLTGWRVLDAFAGSGALGFEAASRGAAEVVLVERDAQLVASLEASRVRLKAATLRVLRGDGLSFLRGSAPRGAFELVLLDPPFDSDLLAPALAASASLLVDGGYVYTESGQPPGPPPAGFELHRSSRAGAVHFQLLRRRMGAAPADAPAAHDSAETSRSPS